MWIQSHYDTIFSAISHTVITDRLIFRRCGAQVVSPSGIHCNYLCQRSGWGCVVGPVCLCVCVSVTRITPNVISQFDWNLILWLDLPVGRVDWLLVVIRSRGGFLITLSLSSAFSCRMGQFRRFISISRAVTGRFSQNSAKWLTSTGEWIQYILGAIRRTPKSWSIRKAGFDSRITYGWGCMLWRRFAVFEYFLLRFSTTRGTPPVPFLLYQMLQLTRGELYCTDHHYCFNL